MGNQVPESVSHFTWLREVSLDEQANRLQVVTLNGESYGFDVPTGEIVESSKPEIRVYDAVVQKKDGMRVALTKFEVCSGAFLVFRQVTEGLSAAQTFHGYVYKSAGTSAEASKTELIELYSVPFSEISRIVHPDQSRDRVDDLWVLHSKRGAISEILTSARDEVAFCGETAAGERHIAVAGEIAEISFE